MLFPGFMLLPTLKEAAQPSQVASKIMIRRFNQIFIYCYPDHDNLRAKHIMVLRCTVITVCLALLSLLAKSAA